MTATGNRGARPVSGMPHQTVEDAVMRTMVAAVQSTVTVLARTARGREFDSPATTAHIHRLGQHIAGVTLDAPRSWPETTE